MKLTQTELNILEELKSKRQIKVIYSTGSGKMRGAKGNSGKRKYDATKKLIEKDLVDVVEKYNSAYGYSLTIKNKKFIVE